MVSPLFQPDNRHEKEARLKLWTEWKRVVKKSTERYHEGEKDYIKVLTNTANKLTQLSSEQVEEAKRLISK